MEIYSDGVDWATLFKVPGCPKCGKAPVDGEFVQETSEYSIRDRVGLNFHCDCPEVSINFVSAPPRSDRIDEKLFRFAKMCFAIREYFSDHDWRFVIDECANVKEDKGGNDGEGFKETPHEGRARRV